jgi:hypothetical protein
MKKRGGRLFKDNTRNPNDAFEQIKAFIPKQTHSIIRQQAEELGLPMSRLVAIAIDNELDCKTPFNYNVQVPTTPYKAYNFAAEAGRILEFLKCFPKGTNRMTLILCRRDMNIPDRDTFLEALRELLHADIVEEFTSNGRLTKYDRENVKIRIRRLDMSKMRKYKYKRIEGKKVNREAPIQDNEIDRGEDDDN